MESIIEGTKINKVQKKLRILFLMKASHMPLYMRKYHQQATMITMVIIILLLGGGGGGWDWTGGGDPRTHAQTLLL